MELVRKKDGELTKTLSAHFGRFPDLVGFERRIGDLVTAGFFAHRTEIFVSRSPGRLDLMGGNDDYTGGLVLEATIREATRVAIQARTDQAVSFYNPAVRELGWTDKVEFGLCDLIQNDRVRPLPEVRAWIDADPGRAWCAYILGALYLLIRKYPRKVAHGFSLYVESDVPMGKGVSSSAALEVASMKALAALYGLGVEGVELASWTQWVEIALTDAACGIMDQAAVAMGDQDSLLPMLCQPCQPLPLVKLPKNLRIWALDSGVRHAIAGIEYETARAATFMGYRLLCEQAGLEPYLDETGVLQRWIDPKWNGYLANLRPSEFRRQYEAHLPQTILGSEFSRQHPVHLDPSTPVRPDVAYPVRSATRYAVEENWRVETFFALLSKSGTDQTETTARLLGELMYQAHVGYGDCGLGCEATDRIVELARAEEGCGILGAKITGGGAGGTVAILGSDTSAADLAFRRILEGYRAWSGQDPYVFEGSSSGSDLFGVLTTVY